VLNILRVLICDDICCVFEAALLVKSVYMIKMWLKPEKNK